MRSALALSYTRSHVNDFYFKTGIHLVTWAGLEPTLHSNQALNLAIILPLLPKQLGDRSVPLESHLC